MARNEAVGFYGPSTHRLLSPHQAAVLDAATHRLVPGLDDMISYVNRPSKLCVSNCPDEYVNGIALLDRQAGGDFTSVSPLRQALILSQQQLASFASLLFGHVIDAIYPAPRQVKRCEEAPSRIATA